MRVRSIVAVAALTMLAGCEEPPQDTKWNDYQRQQQAAAAAGQSTERPAASATPTGADPRLAVSCAEAQETPNGHLSCSFDDGRRFDGMVRNGKANGPGKMWFPNGDRYEGNFVDGLFGGSGTYWYASGARYDGQFANGLRNGQGTTVWPSGSRYSGEYLHNKPHGYGTVTTENGTKSGYWSAGCLASGRVAIDTTLAECGLD